MLERTNTGLSEEVFNDALLRCCPGPGRIFPPANQHESGRRRTLDVRLGWLKSPDVDPENPFITKKVFWIQPGENVHLKEKARQAARAAYKDDPAAYERYVLGKFATVYRGERVTPEYNPEIHRCLDPIIPASGPRVLQVLGWLAQSGLHHRTADQARPPHLHRHPDHAGGRYRLPHRHAKFCRSWSRPGGRTRPWNGGTSATAP